MASLWFLFSSGGMAACIWPFDVFGLSGLFGWFGLSGFS